ncbi:alpha/beta hydrolase [Alteribacter populi]|uniref:alpha/beta hydrolase n=1 Tax=Alteribacter populi TaxID=2011011 RepID=UPI0012FE6BCB|nr:alpha/beta hydrolase [Alteribacter populi]
MAITERYFQMEGEDAVIHLPERPNGFLLLVLGDANHYVEGKTSLWHQHPDRWLFIDVLKKQGYTIVYSNQYGRHWGNDESYRLAIRLIKQTLKTEILNPKIHVFAEGMGALIALRLLVNQQDLLRSVVLFNPCLNLDAYRNHERTKLFFYKKFMKEMSEAYGEEENVLEKAIQMPSECWKKTCPDTMIRIFHCIFQTPFSLDEHSRLFVNSRKERQAPVELTVFLPGKQLSDFLVSVKNFLSNHEQLMEL